MTANTPDAIPVRCSCGRDFKVKAAAAGRTVRCPECKAAVEVTMPKVGHSVPPPVEAGTAHDRGDEPMGFRPVAEAQPPNVERSAFSAIKKTADVSQATLLKGDDSTVDPPERKYPTLLTIQRVCRLLGYVILGAAILVVIQALRNTEVYNETARASVVVTLCGFLMGAATASVVLLAIAELINVMLDIQDNTYRAAKPKREGY